MTAKNYHQDSDYSIPHERLFLSFGGSLMALSKDSRQDLPCLWNFTASKIMMTAKNGGTNKAMDKTAMAPPLLEFPSSSAVITKTKSKIMARIMFVNFFIHHRSLEN
jgi:hypothetical protein